VFVNCFEKGLLVRGAGDTIALSPPLIISKAEIDQLFGIFAEVIRDLS
jgi:beta-alanine--pyruvate transaminase